MILFRASALAEIMTDSKTKDEPLSKGAKTYLEVMAKEVVYSYRKTISGKEMEKGILVEDESIALYNEVFFTKHKKNAVRKNNEWITGECDIDAGNLIIDIKSSWSIPTFPATTATALACCKERGYDWQMRAYMMLWNADAAEVAFCLVNTPDELIGHEDAELHYVDQINPALRVTVARFERDMLLEDKIKFKVDAARKYLKELVYTIEIEHNI